ncbi:helicase-exonuclease AddAB subunit AddA [Paenibacillus antri]|uniref:ATP-dependent helicase/nuclease subunit A n=1 Tax=Paenibacillus antri TaxID=2582848 RepID=A0A5R9G1W1_9BACL|nr:helicase-exonuclease AddAB subunit AddA [Paenibacillus antri]TLS50332.1 helicase-exonuclease AddAB subunit AddA [Paenibacillus antri]
MTRRGIEPKPAGATWTDEQWQAIAARGDHLLVAAAAGSGKTAVLVERIIRTVTDEARPIDIDRLLVATFTNAAAAEMRHRMRDALEKALASNPGSRHLRRQLALVGRASITTLHSFCLDAVRRYVHLTDLDPAFRIANETEAALLRQEALESVLEERYGAAEEDGPFWALADRFGGERGDDGLMKLIDRLYDFSRSHPFPDAWLREAAAAFRLAGPAGDGDGAEIEGGLPEDHPWLLSVGADVKLELEGIAAGLNAALELSLQPGGPHAYADNFRADIAGVERLLKALTSGGWRALRDTAFADDGGAFGRLKPQKGDSVDAALSDRAKKLRKDAKDRLDALKEQLLARTLEDYAAECRELAPLMEELTRLALDYAEAFRQAKTAKGLVDFGDLEHACLQVLRDPASTPERLVPTEAALQYREQFEEVYVDEYQDTNAVQETILRLVSRGDGTDGPRAGNRFMVGDVKQSIYRFRLAEPGLFLRKYKTYRGLPEAVENVAAGGGIRIDLARNFRSRREVVDAVNFVFRQTMHEEAAELDYDERAELALGASYPEPDGAHDLAADVVLIDRDGAPDEEADGEGPAAEAQDLDAAEAEGRAIGRRILELTGGAGRPAMQVYDKGVGGMRPIQFRDIVILLRADKSWAPSLIEQLRLYGVPAHAELGGGYFEAVEVETVLSMLQTIDNPLQDIPLAATMMSPAFGFTAEELARIRVAGGRSRPYYEAVGSVASGKEPNPGSVGSALREKAARFVTTLEPWRTAARQGPLADLILKLYRETGYFDFVGGLPGGVQRQANLRALYDRARQYEATSFRGLFRFLRFIERLRDSGSDLAPARALGETEDVVRIMSIHKSKGLEFPVVFVAGLGKSFNRGDEREPFLLHKELGFGPRFVDPELGAAHPTLPQLAIRRRLRAESLAEEMRVLYVALTRAKEKLILVGSAKGLTKRLEDWNAIAASPGPKLPAHAIHRGACFLDWLAPSLLRHPAAESVRDAYGLAALPPGARVADGSRWRLMVELPDAMAEAAAAGGRTEPWGQHAVKEGLPVPEDWTARDSDVLRALGWTDPRPSASALFAKTSVTEWKGRLLEEDEEEAEAPFAAPSPARGPSGAAVAKRPRFLAKKGLTPVERGVAYHAVMQHLRLVPGLTTSDVEALLSDMVLRELLTEEQRAAVDVESVWRFATSEPGLRLASAARTHRELPFSVGLPAAEVYGEAPNGVPLDAETAAETVLVQGIIDCLFEDERGLAIVDYKTDAIRGETGLSELTERYRLQLSVYAKAAEKALGRDVPDRYLYFFDGARAVKL